MGTIKVFCDHAVFPKWIKELKKKGCAEIFYFPYETRTTKIIMSQPSRTRYNEPFLRYNEHMPYTPTGSEKLNQIEEIIGKAHEKDCLNLDAAYKNSCDCFITADPGDLIGENGLVRKRLEKLLEPLKIYGQAENKKFLKDFKVRS